ncbi:MAG: hypothetical protein HC837_08490 [Chloroflexaceae bacterium]|nr:hypothetical protein [Chloroflexaceae bacterium]
MSHTPFHHVHMHFAFTLLHQFMPAQSEHTSVLSPASILLTLGMVGNGATATTREAITTVMGLDTLSLEQFNQASAAWQRSLDALQAQGTLMLANALWLRDTVPVQPDFAACLQQYYQAETHTLDFQDPAAASRINTWISDRTCGRIPHMIDTVRDNLVLILTNALAFKGKWTFPFDPAETTTGTFYLPDGSHQHPPMMSQTRSDIPYYRSEQFQMIALPYGDDQRITMYLLLPAEHITLADCCMQLDASSWQNLLAQLTPAPGTVVLPRLSLTSKHDLKEVLTALGMGIAFDPELAHFQGISEVHSWIGSILHHTALEVNEAGTEAAAATAILQRSFNPTPPFSMVFDRPFLCIIADTQTDIPLFMGIITEPA